MNGIESEDHRLTADLVALYDVTRDLAVKLEYELTERMDAATDEETRVRYERRWHEVCDERHSLPLGTDLVARKGLIAAWDRWKAEIDAIRAQ